MLHIHQGGTQQTYCGQRLVRIVRLGPDMVLPVRTPVVAWEDAAMAECPDCRSTFFGLSAGAR